MTKKQAIELAESSFWEKMTPREIATFQLHERRLCMPFDVFHKAVEETLNRPVYTHEFGLNIKGLKKELAGEQKTPSMQEIIEMIPEDKRIILLANDGGKNT